METLKDASTTLMFHAEMVPHEGAPSADACSSVGDTAYQSFLDSRSPVFETCAVDEILSLAQIARSCRCTSCTCPPCRRSRCARAAFASPPRRASTTEGSCPRRFTTATHGTSAAPASRRPQPRRSLGGADRSRVLHRDRRLRPLNLHARAETSTYSPTQGTRRRGREEH